MPDLLLSAGINLAFPRRTRIDPTQLDQIFVQRLLKERLQLSDVGDAATTHVVCRRIADRVVLGLSDAGTEDKLVGLCRRFPLLVQALQTRQRQKPPFAVDDEYDVQDLLHGILRLHFDDVRPEEVTPSYAGRHSRVDFFLPRERMMVEAKMTRQNLGQKEIINELSIDTIRYSTMKEVDTLVCLVYDPTQRCTNPVAIERDVEDSGGRLKVRVIVCPMGL